MKEKDISEYEVRSGTQDTDLCEEPDVVPPGEKSIGVYSSKKQAIKVAKHQKKDAWVIEHVYTVKHYLGSDVIFDKTVASAERKGLSGKYFPKCPVDRPRCKGKVEIHRCAEKSAGWFLCCSRCGWESDIGTSEKKLRKRFAKKGLLA